jgi:hypothetical protein
MKKPYIKTHGRIANFDVWIVDGNYIRTYLDKEFTNFGQHYQFNFIPKNEFWIDKKYGEESEERYFIKNMLTMNILLSKGWNYEKAIKKAEEIEKKDRKKHESIFKDLKKFSRRVMIRKVHKKLLKRYSKKLKVWVVKGNIVRDLFFIQFTEGGHDLIYPFIPKREIWLDDDLSKKERKFILLHEIHERNLMAKGWRYDFDDERAMTRWANQRAKIHKSAHENANKVEYYYRHNPKHLKERLMQELDGMNKGKEKK